MSSTLNELRALLHGGRISEANSLLARHPADTDAQVLMREWLIGERVNEQAMPVVQQLAAGRGAEAHVSRSIYALLGGDLRAAVQECQAALAIDPGLATAHNHLGRALHNQGQAEPALQAFREAARLQPDYPQAWQNIGHVMRAIGQMEDAINAYRHALELAPGYRGARINLGITLSLVEQPEAALECFTAVLQDAPDHVEALMNAGLNEHVLGRFTEARRHYDRALSIDPANATAWCYLGLLLNELMDSTGAVNALQKALQLNPMDVEARVELAAVHEQNNRLEQAREMVDAGLAMDPYHPALRLELGRLERREGRIEAALEILRSVNPQHLQPRMATRYHFELGQVLDRHGDHDGAFAAFTASNALQAQSPRRAAIDVDGFSRRASRMQDWLSRGAPGANPAAGELHGDLGADLCFLLGFPRSGTTLLDTFLNAHPAVASIEEYPTLERVIDELRGHPDGYPECLESIDTARLLSLRELYREEVARYLPGREPALILDKLPLRTLNVALIHRLFPAARILLALRHPCDAVLSNFMQQYTENEAFIHFDTLADSAGMYDTVMRVWQTAEQVLDLNAHRTRYEDLVADPGGELDRICTFLSLERVPEMMDTQTRLGAHDRIRTPSYQQVAEPVYRRAAGRWLNYRRHFDPVMDCLEPHIRYFGYAQEDPGDDHGTSGHG